MGCSPSTVLECMRDRDKLDTGKKHDRLETKNSLVSADMAKNIRDEVKDSYPWQSARFFNRLFSQEEKDKATARRGEETDEIRPENLDAWSPKSPAGQAMLSMDEDTEYAAVKGPQDVKPNLLTSSVPGPIKVLLVFGRDDQQSEVIGSVARRLGWSVTVAKSAEKAMDSFQSRCHDLVIIDCRGQRGLDGNSICRSIRSTNCNHSCVVIALVKKSFLMGSDKEEIITLDLLEIGFSRVLVECSHQGILVNELAGIYTSEVQPRAQLAAVHSLYLAVDRCRDMVHVTNDRHIVQFANKASEKLLGYKPEELVGKSLVEVISCENFILMDQQLQRGREWEGNMNCRRKSNEMITINCRIVPFCASGKKPTHYIYVHDTTYLLENMGVAPANPGLQQHPRGSWHSLRRGSFDVRSIGSDTQRRSSLAKLHNLPLEAPITKVIILLSNAMTETMSSNPEVAVQIDKAIDILKTTELYVPQLKEDTRMYNDPVATDLIGALISAPYYSRDSRRSSNDSAKIASIKMLGSTRPSKIYRAPQEVDELLENALNWDFDIFKLEVLSGRRPLVYLGLNLMCQYHVPARLGCDEKTVQNWLTVVEMNYNSRNSYHNSTHAADVLQATAKYMQTERLKMILDPLDEVASLIAAAAHDIDHPGRSSQFLCNSNNKLAILYNDLSVLESHHAALTFKLTLADDSVNIFKNLDREAYKFMRQNVIDMILATEMTKHFEHLAKFVNVCSSRISDAQSEPYTDSVDMAVLLLPENVTLIKRMMIKCADVSNPTRPLRCCVEWARRIAEEYFSQTDEEKRKKLPVVMPMFDRLSCSIPKSQIGFVDFIINDMIEAWDAFIDMPEMVAYMRQNYEKWKEYHEQGISTLQDVEKLQMLPELQVPQLPPLQTQ